MKPSPAALPTKPTYNHTQQTPQPPSNLHLLAIATVRITPSHKSLVCFQALSTVLSEWCDCDMEVSQVVAL